MCMLWLYRPPLKRILIVYTSRPAPAFSPSLLITGTIIFFHLLFPRPPLVFATLGSEINDHLHGSQLLASTILQNTLFEEGTSELALKSEGAYDFYHHPNIQQIQQCQVLLRNFHKEVKVLLQEWPEHPALVQVSTFRFFFKKSRNYAIINACWMLTVHLCFYGSQKIVLCLY